MAAPWPAAPYLAGSALFTSSNSKNSATITLNPALSHAFQFLDSSSNSNSSNSNNSSSSLGARVSTHSTSPTANALPQLPRMGPPSFRLPFAESYRQATAAAGRGGVDERRTEMSQMVFSVPPLSAEQWPVLDPFNSSDRLSSNSSTTNASRYGSNNLNTYAKGNATSYATGYESGVSSYCNGVSSYGDPVSSYDNPERYDCTVSRYRNGETSNYSTGAGSYENGANSYEIGAGIYNNEVSSYGTNATSYNPGTTNYNTGYNTGVPSYNNGVSSYSNGVASYDNGENSFNSSANQFAAVTWTREQHFAPAASAINPSFSDVIRHDPTPTLFGTSQQAVYAAQQESEQQLSVMQDASNGTLLGSIMPPALSPVRSGTDNSTSPPLWQTKSSSITNPAATLSYSSQAPASLAPPQRMDTVSSMSIDEENEELNRAARTLISDEFLRGLSDTHSFGHPTEVVQQRLLPDPMLSEQMQWQPQQQQQAQSRPHQQQPQQSYLKAGVPAQSNGHMQAPKASRVARSDATPSHAAKRVPVSVVVGASLPIKKKAPAKRKRVGDTGVANHRSARPPVPSLLMPDFVTGSPGSSAANPSEVWQISAPSANSVSSTVVRPGATAPFGPTSVLAPQMTKKIASKSRVIVTPGASGKEASMPPMSTMIRFPAALAGATPKTKKNSSAAKPKAVAPALPKEFVRDGWFVPPLEEKKQAPPAKRKQKEKPSKSRSRKAPARAKKVAPPGGKPIDAPQLPTPIEFPGIPLADETVSSVPKLAATAASIAPVASESMVVSEMSLGFHSAERQDSLPTPAATSPTDKKAESAIDPSSVDSAASEVLWTRPTSAAAPAAAAAAAELGGSHPPNHPNNTIVIFCKRDFLRYQAVKLWKKYQEKKKKMEFQTVQVLGKRTRYVNSRYENDAQAPAVKPKKKKAATTTKRARKSKNLITNTHDELHEVGLEILDSPEQADAGSSASQAQRELKNQTENQTKPSTPAPRQQAVDLVEAASTHQIEASDDEAMELVIPTKLAESVTETASSVVPPITSLAFDQRAEGTEMSTPDSSVGRSTMDAIERAQSTDHEAKATEMPAFLKTVESTETMTAAETEGRVGVDATTPSIAVVEVAANLSMNASSSPSAAVMEVGKKVGSSTTDSTTKIAESEESGADATIATSASDTPPSANVVASTGVSVRIEVTHNAAETAATIRRISGSSVGSAGGEVVGAITTIEKGAEDMPMRAVRVDAARIDENLVALMTPTTFEQSAEAVASTPARPIAPQSATSVVAAPAPAPTSGSLSSILRLEADIATFTAPAAASNGAPSVQDALAAAATERIMQDAEVVATTAVSPSNVRSMHIAETVASFAVQPKRGESAEVMTATQSASKWTVQSAETATTTAERSTSPHGAKFELRANVEMVATALPVAPAHLVEGEAASAAAQHILLQSAAGITTTARSSPAHENVAKAIAAGTATSAQDPLVIKTAVVVQQNATAAAVAAAADLDTSIGALSTGDQAVVVLATVPKIEQSKEAGAPSPQSAASTFEANQRTCEVGTAPSSSIPE